MHLARQEEGDGDVECEEAKTGKRGKHACERESKRAMPCAKVHEYPYLYVHPFTKVYYTLICMYKCNKWNVRS